MNSAADTETYREYLYPSINTFMSVAIVFPTIWLTVYPWSHTGGLLAGALASLALAALALVRAPWITVTPTTLSVGGVNIPRSELGGVEVLRDAAARAARGPELNPSAYVLFRGTTRTLVRIQISSDVDPTPYWLISSRRPEALANALS
ncbi:MAG: DUF3093 family protein [Micrococcales bacterium]